METDKKKKQDIKKIDEWQAANVERIVIKPRKEDRISERIQTLIDSEKCKSKQAYIIDAIKTKLMQDEGKLDLGSPKELGSPIDNAGIESSSEFEPKRKRRERGKKGYELLREEEFGGPPNSEPIDGFAFLLKGYVQNFVDGYTRLMMEEDFIERFSNLSAKDRNDLNTDYQKMLDIINKLVKV